jgi:hypothetical protein
VLAVAAIAVSAAGCGNGEQNAYVDQVNALQTQLVDEVTAVTTPPPANAQEAAAIPGQLETAFTQMADDLEAVTPPSEVADLNDQLVTTIRDIAGQFADADAALSSGNAQQAQQALGDLQTSISQGQTELNSLIDQINSALGN